MLRRFPEHVFLAAAALCAALALGGCGNPEAKAAYEAAAAALTEGDTATAEAGFRALIEEGEFVSESWRGIGIIQLGIMGLCCTILSLLTGTFEIPHTGRQWFLIGMLILVCSCFGFAFQPVAQKYLPAETAAVFTVANPLTASFMGIVILGEKISTAKVIGFLLILTALVVYNLDSVRDSEDHDRR